MVLRVCLYLLSDSTPYSRENMEIVSTELEETVGEDIDEQLRIAERELLEAKATYTVRRKAIETVLMSDPTLKAVHLKASSPANR
jgi:hypothetical protein